MLKEADILINSIEEIEVEQRAIKINKKDLINDIDNSIKNMENASNKLDTVTKAIAVLQSLSDESVQESYDYISEVVNEALGRAFGNVKRKIQLNEYVHGQIHPHLEVVIYSKSGKKRSAKATGHGIVQTISLLIILSLIVITKSRRFLMLDEVLSGVSGESRAVICEILMAFADIGFQYIVSEHGMEPKGAKIYHIESGEGEISSIKTSYISQEGKYFGLGDEETT